VLQTLYNLADEQVEYLIRDRLSFMRFLGLGLLCRTRHSRPYAEFPTTPSRLTRFLVHPVP
jgi:Transposase domain (DUF772)